MSSHWIRHSKIEGNSSRQAHCDIPEGTYERELGREGFFGPSSQMYHRHPPTSWESFEGENRPRAFDTTKLAEFGPSPWDARLLLHNNNARLRIWEMNDSMQQLVRNADGDELLFIHAGEGDLFCDYGHMSVSEGDYVLLPRGTMWRLQSSSPMRMLMIEATNSAYQVPEKGMMGNHVVFDQAVLQSPKINEAFLDQQDESDWEVVVKARGGLNTIGYPYNPLDAVGWHGDLVPVKVNWRDIRPLMSHRYHVAPSAHTTFMARGFIVCTFVPRPFETDPGALKVPFFHNNDDYDEVIFYHQGEFFSRDNIHPGMVSFHPCGFTHGPHPGALKNMLVQTADATNEVAVMIDTRDALQVDEVATSVEWTGYVNSWKSKE